MSNRLPLLCLLLSACAAPPPLPEGSAVPAVNWYSANRRWYVTAEPGRSEFPLRQIGTREKILWTVPASETDEYVPADDGRRLIRIAPDVAGPADADRVVVSFYEDGLLAGEYRLRDLVFDLANLKPLPAEEGRPARFAWRTLPARPDEGVSSEGRFYDLTTVENRLIRFEIAGGRPARGLTLKPDPAVEESRNRLTAKIDPVEVYRGKFRPRGLAIDPAGKVCFSDPGVGLVRLGDDGKAEPLLQGIGGAAGVAFGAEGTVWFASTEGARLQVVGVAEPRLRTVAETFKDRRFVGPTDLAVDAAGNVFFADGGAKAEGRTGALFVVTPAGRLYRVAKNLSMPSGLALSADGNALTVAETGLDRLLVFPVDRSGAAPSLRRPRVLAVLPETAKPTGVALDIHGNTYVAGNGSGTVDVIAPTGELLARIPSGGRNPVGLAFGTTDKDADTLYVSHPGTAEGRVIRLAVNRVGLLKPWPKRGAPGPVPADFRPAETTKPPGR